MTSQTMFDAQTAAVLQQAMSAARAGDLVGARSLAERGLIAGGDIVALNAFLGMIVARAGDLAGAVRHLRAAHGGRPDDATIACNLIAALIDLGDLSGAFAIATQPLAMADPSLRIARYRGFLAQSLERFDEAAIAYAHVVDRAPDDFESWNNLGNARTAQGDGRGSIAALEKAVALDRRAAPTRLNLAAALRAADRFRESEAVLREAAADFPGDARPLHELYVQFKAEGLHDQALPVIEEAVRRDPRNASLQFKFAVECGLVMRTADAETAFRQAIASDPQLADAYLGLAVQYEHTNREDEFAPLTALAEANGVDPGVLSFIRALDQRRAKDFEAALESLEKVPSSVEPERTAHIRATLLDRLGQTDEAFHWFAETARLHQAHPSDPLARAATLRETLEAELALLSPAWLGGWTSARPAPERPDPVFLVGFPRSGTTLLDTILMGHPDVVVLEEEPPLNLVDQTLGGMAALPGLNDADIVRLRAQYYEEVAKIAPLAAHQTLVDKSPLFLHKVPLIRRLFPDAKFILAMRHPCDVLLSCYMSNFRLNAAMSNFLRLEDAAAFYDLTFRLWARSTELLPVDQHMIVYERLIDNVETEVRPLFSFLGLDWRDEALDHQQTARTRGMITTASYAQVTEPIYKRAAGRWERYRQHLEPVLPILQPWVDRFGYTL
ncbi:tetratricopeptide repeat-containing sulfotransferase family protein [Sphingomonas sp. 28-62-11]|uniref:tetratricopeptide repeat-containing sulfotransferase family protein n=1 Tax=Sphingomonas sp. 28-62-11 TaxID=1970432 RepID=UPI000BDC23CF|nr:MAG: hypothetical protein B7Y49_01625 [Sphingomonas sp. 28-62-11]